MDSTQAVAGSKEHATRSKGLDKQTLRAKAPLAAQFEDCAQAVKQVHSALNTDPSVEKHTSLHALVGRCLGRLTTWGHETGASSRLLDHSLRRASRLRNNTLTLLQDLHDRFQDAAEALALPAVLEGPGGFGGQPVEEQLEHLTTSPSAAPAPERADTQEMIDILGLEDHDFDPNPEKCLEEAEAIIDDLSDLQSTLLNPYDDDDPKPHSDAAHLELLDQEYIQRVFTQAPPFLVLRLRAANRRRRQNMYQLKQTAGGLGSSSGPNKPRAYSITTTLQYYTRSKGLSSEAGASKTAPSTKDARRSLFSSPTHDDKSIMSFTSGDIGDSLSVVPKLQPPSLASGGNTGGFLGIPELRPPGRPVNLSVDKNIPFQCQYCSFEVPLEFKKQNMALGDWTAHFYLDLQPYICTFEGCTRPHKLFGQKQEWFQHELDYHRTRQVWYCASGGCETEFDTADLFKQHLQASHPDVIIPMPPEFLNIFIETCQCLSLAPQLAPQQQCILCGAVYKEAQVEWKDHLAHHLEQFALLAIGEDEEHPSAEDEVDRQEATAEFASEMGAVYASRRALLAAANNEALKVTQGSMRPGESVGPNYVGGRSDEPGDSGGEGHGGEQAKPLWKGKVDSFVKEQPDKTQADKAEAMETIWLHVPKRNEEFVGRDHDLHSLNEYISQPGHICVISGHGGIGKTAMAAEYAHRFKGDHFSVIWIEAGTPGGLTDKYNSIGTEIFKLGDETEQGPLSLILNIRGMLERWERKWLIIFDNVESWDDIALYIPRGLAKTEGSILITTRRQDLIKMDTRTLQRVLRRIEIDPLTTEEGVQFVISINPHVDYQDAVRIADLVERLPLALMMVSGYAKASRATLKEFLEVWEEKSAFRAKHAKRNKLITDGGLDSSIDLLWDIGISDLSVPARNLLEILAFLDPENIQKDLLVGDHNERFLEFLNSTETALYKRMIRQLSGRKLIEVREQPKQGGLGESYRIHRLLQQKIILDMGDQLKLDGALTKATRLVRKMFPKAPPTQAPAPQNSKLCRKYMPHVFSLLRAFTEANGLYPDVEKRGEMADLFYDAGFYLWDSQAEEHGGLAFLNAAELIIDSVWVEMDAMHPRRADIHCILGLLRSKMGCQERDESVRRLKLALDIRKHVYDRTDPYDRDVDVLLQNSTVDYGILLLNAYDFGRAEAIFEQCLGHYRDWGSEENIPFEYSKYCYNMGVVRLYQSRMYEAIHHLQRSVDLNAFTGKEGCYWDNYFMLACAIHQSGDFQTALDMHRKILKSRLEQLGKHSSATILSTYAVAEMYMVMGDFQSAIEHMEHCIDLATATGWTDESLGRARLHLSLLYRQYGVNLDEVEALETKAMETLTKHSQYVSKWVAQLKEPIMMFDDLQPTDGGRYLGTMLLQVLWARRRGDKAVTFYSPLEQRDVTLDTGL